MKHSNLLKLSLTAFSFLLVAGQSSPVLAYAEVGVYKPKTVTTTPATTTTSSTSTTTPVLNYRSCDKYEDYVSYVRCIAEVDSNLSKANSTTDSTQLPGKAADYSVVINNGAAKTSNKKITVTLKAPAEATIISMSKDSNFGFSPREAFAATKTWELEDVDNSTQYIYIKFYDKDGNGLFIASDSIVYSSSTTAAEATAPAATASSTTETAKDCKLKIASKTSLTVGNKGTEVKALQESLKCLGHLPADFKVTGTFDAKTEDGVKAFQKANNLKCNDKTYCGVVGPATAKILTNLKVAVIIPAKTATATTTKATVIKAPFSKPMTIGSKGTDVKALQEYLASDSEWYPEGDITGTFDQATEDAVSKYQEENGLKCNDGTYCGYVGPATIKKLNAAYLQFKTK